LLLYDRVEVAHRGVALGVEDHVHVLGAPYHTELCDRFVRADNELHARAHAVDKALAAVGVACATCAEHRPPLADVDFALEA
jgi:hypothetical protein